MGLRLAQSRLLIVVADDARARGPVGEVGPVAHSEGVGKVGAVQAQPGARLEEELLLGALRLELPEELAWRDQAHVRGEAPAQGS